MVKQEKMKNLKVFSKKLGTTMDFFSGDNRLIPATVNAWMDRGWNNSGSWMDRGWNNSGNWTDRGWNNSGNWTDRGWNNSGNWTDRGWSNSSGGGGCYITTAAVDHIGLADDCDQLNILRMYRDQLAEEDQEFRKVVLEYYKTAPMIVEKISNSPDKDEILEAIYTDMVIPVIKLLQSGEVEAAKKHYINKYNELKSKYILEPQKQLVKSRNNQIT